MKRIQSIITAGFTGTIVEVECQLSNGLPIIVLVGLGNKAVDEAKERLRGAFAATGTPLPRKRITINLAPAGIPKDSTSLDLAIAAAIFSASTPLQNEPDKHDAIIGEVGLDGEIRAVRGIIGTILAGKKLGITTFFVPTSNKGQALLVPGTQIIPVSSLKELFGHLTGEQLLSIHVGTERSRDNSSHSATKLSMIVGQAQAKRALQIVAAGGHNILLSGPPGTGKSMLAKALPSLLPPLSHQEVLEVTHLHSLANNDYERLIEDRPLRAPHHSASHVSIVGGGAQVKPGEITLSHRGVLFLDELPEFNRQTIEALRQPLEERVVTIARARHTIEYPAHFTLVGTANPCPCGYFATQKPCQCTPAQLLRYRQKLSGPIMDRIDLHVTVAIVEHESLLKNTLPTEEDALIRDRVRMARALQEKRYGDPLQQNADMTNEQIKQLALLDEAAVEVLNTAAARLDISARSYMKIIKVARTIADLENCTRILTPHIAEALQFRAAKA